jgi:hypothetical protein
MNGAHIQEEEQQKKSDEGTEINLKQGKSGEGDRKQDNICANIEERSNDKKREQGFGGWRARGAVVRGFPGRE